MKKIHKAVIQIIVTIILCYAGFIVYNMYSLKQAREATLTNMNSSSFSCPNGATQKITGWGFNGYSRYCEVNGQKTGPWEAWEGYLRIRGNFKQNLKHGEWLDLDKNGNITSRGFYSEGSLVPENKK